MDQKVIQAGKFDQKSTGADRRQFLQTILHAVRYKKQDFKNPILNNTLHSFTVRFPG